MMKCTFCKAEAELHEVEAPAIRLCSSCRKKLETHIAVICTGCDTLYWLPKTPKNIAMASEMGGLDMVELMEGAVIHQIKSCRGCYEAVKEFTVTAPGPWVQ